MHARLRILFGIAFALGLGMAAPSAVAAGAGDKAAFVRQAIALHFVPRIAAFARTTAPLVEAIDAMCREPGPATLGSARAAFVRSLLAWESASAISYGPIATRRSVYRIDFWPVRTSLLLPLLGNPPATVAELERVGGPAKGYPAL
jgi:predicted lipoprotein